MIEIAHLPVTGKAGLESASEDWQRPHKLVGQTASKSVSQSVSQLVDRQVSKSIVNLDSTVGRCVHTDGSDEIYDLESAELSASELSSNFRFILILILLIIIILS